MMRGFYNGVSGIKTQSFGMDVWSNNVANINNVGYKASLPEFKSIFYQTSVAAGNTPTSDQVGLGAVKQTTALDFSEGGFQNTDETFDIGIGGEGFFGVQAPNGKTYYTRTGHFDTDAAGNLVDDSGNLLLGTMNEISPITPSQKVLRSYGQTLSGTTPQAYTMPKTDSINLASEAAQTGINLPKFLYMPAEATTTVNFRGNLDSTRQINDVNTVLDSSSYRYSVDDNAKNITINGSVSLSTGNTGFKSGDTVNIRVSDNSGHFSDFTATLDNSGAWSLDAQSIRYLDTANLSVTASITSKMEVANSHQLKSDIFNADGTKSLVTVNLTKQIPQEREQTTWNATATITDENGNVTNSAQGALVFGGDGTIRSNTLSSVGSVALNFGASNGSLVYNGMTSAANAKTDFTTVKDGFAEGILKDYKVDDSGHIMAHFDNSRSFAIAKIALYHFQNDQGIAKIGDNLYEATRNSGEAFFYKNRAGETIYGSKIKSGVLEMSNVNLAQALTEIIVIQKAYDASSKSITTSDEMIQTAIQMKK